MTIRLRTMWILAATALAAGGCGGDRVPSLGKVHGKVVYKGKPLTSGRVLFVPTKQGEGESRIFPAGGDIKTDGTYELTTMTPGDGAALGEHKVVLEVFEDPGKSPPVPGVMMKPLIPRKYTEVGLTPLTRTVAAGDNTFDIEVTD